MNCGKYFESPALQALTTLPMVLALLKLGIPITMSACLIVSAAR
jgi:hypothetical protein